MDSKSDKASLPHSSIHHNLRGISKIFSTGSKLHKEPNKKTKMIIPLTEKAKFYSQGIENVSFSKQEDVFNPLPIRY